jgi:amino acid transporter
VVAGISLVNVLGVRDAAIVSDFFTIGKLAPLLLLIAVGLFFLQPQRYALGSAPGFGEFSASCLLLVYAFSGFEMAIIPAGEAQDPRRNLPFALITAVVFVAVIYMLIQLVCIGTLANLATSKRPLADAASSFLGSAGGAIISAGAVVSILGNLNVILLAGSRLPFAMAERNELPKTLGTVHRRFRTPHVSITITGAVMLVLTLSGTFVYAATISAIARLLTYFASCAALPVLRKKERELPAAFRAPAGVALAVIALVLCVWLLSNSSREQQRDSLVAAAIGLVIYLVYKRWHSRASAADAIKPPA